MTFWCSFRERFQPEIESKFLIKHAFERTNFRYSYTDHIFYHATLLDFSKLAEIQKREKRTYNTIWLKVQTFFAAHSLFSRTNEFIRTLFKSSKRVHLYTSCTFVWKEPHYNEKPINKFYSLITIMKSMPMKMEKIEKVNAIISTDISCDFYDISCWMYILQLNLYTLG